MINIQRLQADAGLDSLALPGCVASLPSTHFTVGAALRR